MPEFSTGYKLFGNIQPRVLYLAGYSSPRFERFFTRLCSPWFLLSRRVGILKPSSSVPLPASPSSSIVAFFKYPLRLVLGPFFLGLLSQSDSALLLHTFSAAASSAWRDGGPLLCPIYHPLLPRWPEGCGEMRKQAEAQSNITRSNYLCLVLEGYACMRGMDFSFPRGVAKLCLWSR